jgi:hypothetical protein
MSAELNGLIETLKLIVSILVTGGLAGLVGYMKQNDLPLSWKAIFSKKFWASFEPTMAFKTIVVAAVVNLVAYAMGLEPDVFVVQETGIMTVIVYFADALVKVIVRRTPLVRFWNWLKDKFDKWLYS